MEKHKLPARKRDLLDDLNLLRNRRSLAYRFNDRDELARIHLEMRAFWMRNGWTEQEAQDEYLKHVEECSKPYQSPVGLLAITHSVYDRKSGNTFENLSLAELSDYYLFG
ncbi:MAG: hypothetical protein U0T74_15585 [Chitinophagales bacterium]